MTKLEKQAVQKVKRALGIDSREVKCPSEQEILWFVQCGGPEGILESSLDDIREVAEVF